MFKTGPRLMAKQSIESDSVSDNYEGYFIDLVDAVAKTAELNYTIHLDDTTHYNDLVQALVDNKTDLVVADLTITEERLEVIDFSIPFMRNGLAILMKKPSTRDPNPFSFLSPFSLSIWVCILAAYLAVSFLLALVTRLVTFDNIGFIK